MLIRYFFLRDELEFADHDPEELRAAAAEAYTLAVTAALQERFPGTQVAVVANRPGVLERHVVFVSPELRQRAREVVGTIRDVMEIGEWWEKVFPTIPQA